MTRSLCSVRSAAATLLMSGLVLTGACTDADTIRIGVVLSEDGLLGASMAADEVNAAGGVRGRALAILPMHESATDARGAIEVAERFSSDPSVIAVVGHSNSGTTLAASQIYNRNRLPHIAPTSSAPLISQAGDYTFRLVASDIHQARFLADAITAGGAAPRTAILFVNDDYGRPLHAELRDQLRRRGVPLVFDAPFLGEPRFTDPEALASSVAKTNPSVLVWIGRAGELRDLVPHLRRVLPDLPIVASDGALSPVLQHNRDGVFTGLRFVRFRDLSSDSDAIRDFRDRFRRHGGAEVTDQAALAYEAVHLLTAAIDAGGTTREQVREYLQSIGSSRTQHLGVTGPIAFDTNGDALPVYVMVVMPPPSSTRTDR